MEDWRGNGGAVLRFCEAEKLWRTPPQIILRADASESVLKVHGIPRKPVAKHADDDREAFTGLEEFTIHGPTCTLEAIKGHCGQGVENPADVCVPVCGVMPLTQFGLTTVGIAWNCYEMSCLKPTCFAEGAKKVECTI